MTGQGVTANASAPYAVLWGFAADLGGEHFTAGIELRLQIQGGNTLTLSDVAQGNDPPQLGTIQASPPGQEKYTGSTDVLFEFADSGQDPVTVRVEFNDDPQGGFPESA